MLPERARHRAGTLSGMLAADLAARGNDPMVADLLAMEPPRRLPPEPLAWAGATARMRWAEWQAGREISLKIVAPGSTRARARPADGVQTESETTAGRGGYKERSPPGSRERSRRTGQEIAPPYESGASSTK